MNWFLKGLKNGIKTERFPVGNQEYLPGWSTRITGKGNSYCPTGAINEGKWDPEKCIFCRMCFPNYQPTGDSRIGIVNNYNKAFKKSLFIYPIDVGSCGGCNLELNALTSPHYDISRFGIFFVNTPKHADALIVLGKLSEKMIEPLVRAYDSMPDPKIAIAGCSGAIMSKMPIKFDAVVPGCPPNPYTYLYTLVKIKNGEMQ